MRKGRFLFICISMLVVMLTLGSCFVTTSPNELDIPKDGVIFSKDRSVTLVISDDNNDAELNSVYGEVYRSILTLDIDVRRVTDAAPQGGSEIVIGPSNRAATAVALEKISGADPQGVAYAICYKDGALAIVAVNSLSYKKALEIYYGLIVDGVLRVDTDYCVYVNSALGDYEAALLEEKRAQDLEEYDHRFDEVREVLDAEGYAAVQALYSDFLGTDIYTWYSSLYDPDVGGFYFSDSARGYEGFLPDVESTYQILSDIRASGMLDVYAGKGDKLAAAMPSDMQEKLIAWVRSLQSAADGYFYHPQWGSDVSVDRQGRDLGWGINILGWFGAKPLYPTALDRLQGAKATSAVSKVIAVAANDHLKSEEAFKAWLYAQEDAIKENSHGTGHKISAQSSQIVAAGFGDIACDFFDKIQRDIYEEQVAAGETPTGLWQRGLNYTAITGLYKIGIIYRDAGRVANYLDLCVDSGIAVVLSDADTSPIIDVYNPWAGLNMAISMMEMANGYDLDAAYAKVRASFAQMMDVTLEKMSKYRKDDGAFSYYKEHSVANMYGSSISLGLDEGDVNATHLMFGSMASAMFSAIGVARPKTYSCSDMDAFFGELESAGSIVKNVVDSKVDYDFEDLSEGECPSAVTGGEAVADPEDYSNTVLMFNSVSGVKDNATFNVNFGSSWSCAYFDTRLRLSDVSHPTAKDNIPTHQIRFASNDSNYVYMLTLTAKGDRIIIGDNSSTSTGGEVGANLGSLPLGEWCDLRVEVYSGDSDSFRVKVYLNGHCLIIRDNFYGSHEADAVPNAKITKIVFYGMEKAASTLMFDDFEADVSDDKFSDGDYEGEVDSNIVEHDFEDGRTDFISAEIGYSGSGFSITERNDGEGNALKLHKESNEAGAKDQYSFNSPAIKSDVIRVGFDINMDEASAGGIQLAIGNWGKAPFVLFIMAKNGGYTLACTRNTADSLATVEFADGTLANGWNRIELVVLLTDDPEEFIVEIYLNDELIAESADYYYGNDSTANPATSVPMIVFRMLKNITGEVYMDNLVIEFE